jgi:hypothetical protein
MAIKLFHGDYPKNKVFIKYHKSAFILPNFIAASFLKVKGINSFNLL